MQRSVLELDLCALVKKSVIDKPYHAPLLAEEITLEMNLVHKQLDNEKLLTLLAV